MARKTGYLNKTFCFNGMCHRIETLSTDALDDINTSDENALKRATDNLLKLDKHDAFADELGNYWCKECEYRGRLVNWAKERKWPAVSCPPYAVEHGEYFWIAALRLGDDTYVQAIQAACGMAESEQVP